MEPQGGGKRYHLAFWQLPPGAMDSSSLLTLLQRHKQEVERAKVTSGSAISSPRQNDIRRQLAAELVRRQSRNF
eukprot:5109298-Pleurochrysis_carterae.AAC.1